MGPALEMVDAMEEDGVPLLAPRAVVDAREGGEAEEKWRAEGAAQREDAAARAEWQEWRNGEAAGMRALEALDAPASRRFAAQLRKAMGRELTDEALDEGMRRFREVQGVGLGGFMGVWVAKASEATRRRYKAALRGVAAEVRVAAYEMERARTPEERRLAMEAVRAAAPRGWTRWLVILLTKPGKPRDVLSKRRDIYLQPHSLKLFMNGCTPAYDAAQRAAQPAANTGFRPGGSATQTALVLGLMMEEAVAYRKSWYRGYCDKGGFFQSVVRRLQRAAEARCGVPTDVTEVVLALHESLVVAYDSGEGLTPGTESGVGNGQGDSKGPSRSMEALAIETRAVEWLVAGCAFRAPMGVARRRTPSCWFADDGAFQVDSFATLQMTFTVMSVMARVLGFTVGIDADPTAPPTATRRGGRRRNGTGTDTWRPGTRPGSTSSTGGGCPGRQGGTNTWGYGRRRRAGGRRRAGRWWRGARGWRRRWHGWAS